MPHAFAYIVKIKFYEFKCRKTISIYKINLMPNPTVLL